MKYTCCISAPPERLAAVPRLYRACTTLVPRLYHARTSPVPRSYRDCTAARCRLPQARDTCMPIAAGGCKSRHNWTVFLNPRRVFIFPLIEKTLVHPQQTSVRTPKIWKACYESTNVFTHFIQLWASQNLNKQEYIGMYEQSN